MEYQPIIGLEIHTELATKAKMFCSCKNDSKETRPNFNICPVCMAHPGTLPTINKKALEMVIKTGMALSCRIEGESFFERKNYFYPDLPKGYQISQYQMPLCNEGFLDVGDRKVKITRIHLEEDTGKLIHPKGKDYSLVDFNRAGVPLMELVTSPDIFSGTEARMFAESFQLILRYLGISDADMEKGQMRVEVNISLRKKETDNLKLGTKIEIKNLNSFRSIEKATKYEIKRQNELLEKGMEILQETRGWDDVKESTFSQRKKEEAHDYRYFPEPDIPPFFIDEIKKEIKDVLPELPNDKRKRLKDHFNLNQAEAEVLIKNKELSDYFENICSEIKNWMKFEKIPKDQESLLIKTAINYLVTDILGFCKKFVSEEKKQLSFVIKNIKITPENFAEFVVILWKGEISSKAGKETLFKMFEKGGDPSYIIEDMDLKKTKDEDEIKKVVKKIINENKKATDDYKKGKESAIQFLLGQVMRETRGKVDPDIIIKTLKEILN